MRSFCRVFLGDSAASYDFLKLKHQYLVQNNQIQRHKYSLNLPKWGAWDLRFEVSDPETHTALCRLLELNSITSSNCFDEPTRHLISEQIRTAQVFLERRFVPGSIIVNLLVDHFVLLKVPGSSGGSFGTALGMIWLNPQSAWGLIDFVEAIYHEVVHQALFLEQLVWGMYSASSEMAEDDAHVTSAVLQVRRPFDAAFHSAWVALALAEFASFRGDAERAVELLVPLRHTISQLRAKDRYLDAHGELLLSEMEDRFSRYNRIN